MVIFFGAASSEQTQLSLSFLYQPPLVNLEKLLLTVQGFQSTSPEQIHFPKLIFYLYCMLCFF